jgi:anti-sigma B factor antagonist
MPASGFPVSLISGIPVVSAPFEIDISNADELRTALLSAGAHGHATLVVDMSGTAFCDSVGLHVLVHARQQAAAEGGELRLVLRAASLLRLFRATGMDRAIPCYATLTEALRKLPAIAIRPHSPRLAAPPRTAL